MILRGDRQLRGADVSLDDIAGQPDETYDDSFSDSSEEERYDEHAVRVDELDEGDHFGGSNGAGGASAGYHDGDHTDAASSDAANGSSESLEPSGSPSGIPEVDIEDMIALANQMVQEDGRGEGRSLRFRIPRRRGDRRSDGDMEAAREIILEHERHTGNYRLQRDTRFNTGNGRNGGNGGGFVGGAHGHGGNGNGNGHFPDGGVPGVGARPFWMELVDFMTITLFLVMVFRLIRNALSVTSFSTDIIQDTFEFMDAAKARANSHVTPDPAAGPLATTSSFQYNLSSNYTLDGSNHTSLIMKFGDVIERQFPSWGSTWKVLLTICTFYPYTIISSSLLIASLIFSIFCMALSVGKRWHSLQEYFLSLVKNGEDVI